MLNAVKVGKFYFKIRLYWSIDDIAQKCHSLLYTRSLSHSSSFLPSFLPPLFILSYVLGKGGSHSINARFLPKFVLGVHDADDYEAAVDAERASERAPSARAKIPGKINQRKADRRRNIGGFALLVRTTLHRPGRKSPRNFL